MTINYFIIFPTAVFPGHKICQLRNNNLRLRTGVVSVVATLNTTFRPVLTVLIGAAIIPSYILAFPTDLDNTEKRGSTAFRLYTCPLGDKRCDKRGIRWPYAPYWFKHTFIEIEGMCYDWGNWNYPRAVKCTSDEFSCCYGDRKRKYTGYSSCTSRVGEFEDAWDDEGSSYNLLTWNCQRYSDAMKDFLNRCYSDVSRAIP